MAFLRIRGARLAFEDVGAGDPVLFIHGHPFNRSMWKEQVSFFANRYRLILPDLRGYGESEGEGTRNMLDEMALDLAHLLDELRIDRVVLCGLSMGGQIALDFYRMFPGRVRALVIADSDAKGETAESRQKRLLSADFMERVGMRQYTDEHIHEFIASASLRNETVYRHLYDMMTGTRVSAAVAAHRGRAERRDHLDALGSIAVPTLLVVGSEDLFTPESVMEVMRKRIPGARLVCIPGAGHLPNMETPAAFNEALDAFLTNIKTTGR
ncbi:alpha/beta fold hydrolase [Dinghuibacter silviterrae]|uniref:Pimeloyl-ACP methyl ester carboxylesterase n=1 Tax=Dinghuibacter silviterrae TaxID=1539049 RepID=A0A4R8DNZ1_9BACT|nr:alpha/beta fold hydrolase [Dinghuibacter silviterrae]TDW99809.1 pimeloyl-ACP methyl ester carboxylesterase [Dinghuibacter silviterrae]